MANTFMLHNITDVEITDKNHTTQSGHEFRCIDISLKTTEGDITINLFPVKDADFYIEAIK